MLPRINPLQTRAWQQLKDHFKEMEKIHMWDLFKIDNLRFPGFSVTHHDLLFDYSKNRINHETIRLLILLAEECGLPSSIKAMFSGDPINGTENRSVLHTALRNFSNRPVFANGVDVMPGVKKVLDKMKKDHKDKQAEFCKNHQENQD